MRAPDFWRRDGLWPRLLTPLGALYGASVARKARAALPFRMDVPVVCVGNLTAGGSGKTPIAIALAQTLIAHGRAPFFLTRGYGGRVKGPWRVTDDDSATHVGDEPLLLARAAPVIVAADRAAGAKLARREGADVIVMDDGHQNFALHKDLALVVVDGESGFGNRRMIPAGPLREPIAQGLARADAVIVIGGGDPDLGGFAGPVLRAHLAVDAAPLAGQSVFAFAGIGRPQKFFDSLRAAGVRIEGARAFADHHPYSATEIAALKATGLPLVTTEKDWARLPPAARAGIAAVPAEARFDDPAALARLLDRLGRGV
jgi:tetraacyldisaccharide 4'-kinase